MNSIKLRKAIRSKYAWPGGYPLAVLLSDGECLCIDCTKENYRQIARANRSSARDCWKPEAVFVNWEDHDLLCAHCSREIESAH